MKRFRSITFVIVSIIIVTSCFEPPDFPVTPQIKVENIYFREVGNASQDASDSLIITISFKDGDGNLGLDPTESGEPYNDIYYYLADNNKIATVRSAKYDPNSRFYSIDKIPALGGSFRDIPSLQDSACTPHGDNAFVKNTILVPTFKHSSVDTTYMVRDKDTKKPIIQVIDGTPYFAVSDTFFVKKNVSHYNIEIRFWDKNNNEVDWGNIYSFPTCGENWHGRFPILFEDDKRGPIEGTLTYALVTDGFIPLLGTSTWRITVQIRDRSLNVSNQASSIEFTLNDIKKTK